MLRRFADWTKATDPTAEIDGCISRLVADKHARETRVVELLTDEVAAGEAIVSAQHDLDKAHRLRDAEEVLCREDDDEINRLLEERATLKRRPT